MSKWRFDHQHPRFFIHSLGERSSPQGTLTTASGRSWSRTWRSVAVLCCQSLIIHPWRHKRNDTWREVGQNAKSSIWTRSTEVIWINRRRGMFFDSCSFQCKNILPLKNLSWHSSFSDKVLLRLWFRTFQKVKCYNPPGVTCDSSTKYGHFLGGWECCLCALLISWLR